MSFILKGTTLLNEILTDHEIQFDNLNTLKGVKIINLNPHYDKCVLPKANGRPFAFLALNTVNLRGTSSVPGQLLLS